MPEAMAPGKAVSRWPPRNASTVAESSQICTINKTTIRAIAPSIAVKPRFCGGSGGGGLRLALPIPRGGPRAIPHAFRRPRAAEGAVAVLRGPIHPQPRMLRNNHQHRKNGPPTEAIAEYAHGNARERAKKYGYRDEQRGLRGGQMKDLAESWRERADHAPGGEAQDEGNGSEREMAAARPHQSEAPVGVYRRKGTTFIFSKL
jgi:hypothetical protein